MAAVLTSFVPSRDLARMSDEDVLSLPTQAHRLPGVRDAVLRAQLRKKAKLLDQLAQLVDLGHGALNTPLRVKMQRLTSTFEVIEVVLRNLSSLTCVEPSHADWRDLERREEALGHAVEHLRCHKRGTLGGYLTIGTH